MNTYSRFLFFFFFLVFAVFTGGDVFAQSITIGAVDPGPYAPGSTVAIPVHINDAGGCIKQSNGFYLYLSDAVGSFAASVPIAIQTNSFYITYANFTLPSGLPAGAAYQFQIKGTNPNITSNNSNTITVVSGTAPVAKIDAPLLNNTKPDIFGACAGTSSFKFTYNNTSSGAIAAAASFFNEKTQTTVAVTTLTPSGNTFSPEVTNYSVFVKAVNSSNIISTRAYTLVNNIVNNSIGATNGGSACISSGGGATLYFNVDISSASGIQQNFPGNLYHLTWGDGRDTLLSYCEIKSLGGQVPHTYTTSSCANNVKNAFIVEINVVTPYCGNVGTPLQTSAIVLKEPKSEFNYPLQACTGKSVTFTNTSFPGQDPNTTSIDCSNPNARYTWYVDGIPIEFNKALGDVFEHTFATKGQHTVGLEFQSNSVGATCAIPIVEHIVCVQEPAKPSFTMVGAVGNTLTMCQGITFSPTNTSEVDIGCTPNVFTWTMTGPGTPNYKNGTGANSYEPAYNLNVAGVYTLHLAISNSSCGVVDYGTDYTIVVNTTPVAKLSANFQACGKGLSLTFDNNATQTKTTLTGTSQTQAGTYTWTVVPPAGGTYAFVNGTTAGSQYPKIQFNDYGTYTVSVKHHNECSDTPDSQNITFLQSTVIDAGADQTICFNGGVASLNGSFSGPAASSVKWTSTGTGIFSAPAAFASTYTPSAADRTLGHVTLTLTGTTTNPPPCNAPSSSMILTITPPAKITSAPTKAICSGNAVAYTPVADTASSTYAWTATQAPGGTATGFSNGSGSSITDIITNTSDVNPTVVTYTITPTSPAPASCVGTPFTFKVTINPNPTVTLNAAVATICSRFPTGITLQSSQANTTYTWTSTVTGSIVGNQNQATPINSGSIPEILINNGATLGSVTYTVTPISSSGCPGTPKNITIFVQPDPKESIPGATQELCNATSAQLNANDPSPGTGKWTIAKDSPSAVFADDTNPATTVTGLIPGKTYVFTWSITATPACDPKSNSVIVIDNLPTVAGTTSGSAVLCSGDTRSGFITLADNVGRVLYWERSTDNGVTWVNVGNSNSGSQAYVNPTLTAQYRTVVQNGTCNIERSTISTVTVNQATPAAFAGPSLSICNQPSYTLQGNDPGTFAGKWTLVSGQSGVVFADDSKYNTTVSGLSGGQTYVFRWTISPLPGCSPSSLDVTITDDAPSFGGTTTGGGIFCAGNISGQILLGGNVGKVLNWETSTDNGVTWVTTGNTTTAFTYTNPSKTTQYRANVQNGSCSPPVPSAISTVTVNPPTPVAFAGPDDKVCNVSTYTLQGNNPATFVGQWTLRSGQTGVVFTDASKYNTTVTGLVGGQTYVFRWTIFGLPLCGDTFLDVTITNDAASVGGITSGSVPVCAGANSGQILLTGNVGSVVRWESSTDNGTTWFTVNNTTNALTYTNPVKTTLYRAVVKNGVCSPPDISTVSTVTVNPATPVANAGQPATLCNQSSYVLQGNDPGAFAGKWTLTSGQTGVTFVDDTKYNTTVNGLKGGNNYTFAWTITGLAPCPDSQLSVTITNLAPLINTLPPATTICAGQDVLVKANPTTGGDGTYTYSWENSTDDVNWFTVPNETNADLSATPPITTWYRRTVISGTCTEISNEEKVVVQQTISNNVLITNRIEICYNTAPDIISGTVPDGGDGNFIYKWQSSTDGITFTDIPGATGIDYQPPVLTVTTQYHRIVSTSLCLGAQGNISKVITITVNPDAKAAFTAAKQTNCAPFLLNSLNITASNDPGTDEYEWFADGVSIGKGISFPGYTILQDGLTVKITLQVTSKFGCKNDTYSLDFKTVKNVTAHIQASRVQNCGPVEIQFTNASTPLNGAGYTWSFNDGKPDSHEVNPKHTFDEDPTGRDATYRVTLTPDGCSPIPDFVDISIFPKIPVSRIRLASVVGCAPAKISVENISPGNNIDYTYYLKDPNGGILKLGTFTDKDPKVFDAPRPTKETIYYIYMVARNQCGGTAPSIEYPFKVLPSEVTAAMSITSANAGQDCAPLIVKFTNLSAGGNIYTYNIYDSNLKLLTGFPTVTAEVPYQLPSSFKPGTYYVTVTASNGCSVEESGKKDNKMVLYPNPAPAFHAVTTSGCDNIIVDFINDTPDDPDFPSSNYTYTWDFGDGQTTTTTYGPVRHSYDSSKPAYTVTLTATTPYGCVNAFSRTDYIVVNKPPVSKFAVKPDTVTNIPNYRFEFIDQSTGGPLAYGWTFGDGASSNGRNPGHSYADTGRYVVTLTTRNTITGCDNTVKQVVRITGVPGQLYVPNSFMPSSGTTELQTFKAKGSGIKIWSLRIFNNWGQMIYETTALNKKGEPTEGWDGTFKGVPMPQGVYAYEISATFINGTEYKGMSYGSGAPRRSGVIHLIR